MKIFISYRRADSKYVVDRIRDRLLSVYDKDSVFRDIESIPLGENFSEVLNRATQGCDVMLVVIGPQWVSVTDAKGNKRLNDLNDYTRIEVETGLANKDILVIPVLVMDAMMPTVQDIPESLSDLLFRNAISVRNDPDFEHDMQRLIQGINQAKGGSEPLPVQYFEPETVYIPPGSFLMGSEVGPGIPSHETPKHEVTLPAYRISKYPVLNREYAMFVTQSKTEVSAPLVGFSGLKPKKGFENQPVKGVTLKDARVYCQWLNEVTKPIDNEPRKYDLPNEAQLEKIYHGDYGCFDIFEEIYLWTCTLWGENSSSPDYGYPWTDTDGRNNPDAKNQIRRVVCRYKKMDGADRWQRESRNGQYPEKPFASERYSFRVVMTV